MVRLNPIANIDDTTNTSAETFTIAVRASIFLSFLSQSNSDAIPAERDSKPFREQPFVTIIMVMNDATLPLAEIKKHLSQIVDRVEHHHERVVLTRRGRPAAVLVSPDDLASLEETLDILSQPSALEEIRRAQRSIDAGDYLTGDEIRATYLGTE
jgi:prevent-host-death family protein